MFDDNRPIYTLTVGEFKELYREIQYGCSDIADTQQREIELPNRRYVYGIRGLAELLGCSKPTAQKLKNSGKIDEAISQIGRKITIDADKTLEILSINKNKIQ